MYEYITGDIAEITPTYLVVENKGVAYILNISLNTYTAFNIKKEGRFYIHQVIREDNHQFYGFADKQERELFRLLISVSGVGATTAQMMLSSMEPLEIKEAIAVEDVQVLKAIKGIGAKTAQRIIIELKDKVGKGIEGKEAGGYQPSNPQKEEALAALAMLGFKKTIAEKVVTKVLKSNREISVEELIKLSLKQL